jgi:hypothetical protein
MFVFSSNGFTGYPLLPAITESGITTGVLSGQGRKQRYERKFNLEKRGHYN